MNIVEYLLYFLSVLFIKSLVRKIDICQLNLIKVENVFQNCWYNVFLNEVDSVEVQVFS